MFIDYAKIYIKSGDGGDGAITFRREKFVPKGGPSGGNGGKGGDVIFVTDTNLTTLLDFQYKKKYVAQNGAAGANSLKDGKYGEDIIIRVPVGTLVKDAETDEIICDLVEPNSSYVIAKGGKGGKGNSNFATSTNQTPRYAQDGKPGEERTVVLELKLIADIGLVGFPNAGKSTLISNVSAARPKIADYPFTTLEPNLGIVRYKDAYSFTIADIPGIIEGAHQGKGLGLKFLRHIERTKILLIMIDVNSENYAKDFKTLINELDSYSHLLAEKRKILAFTKSDLITKEEIAKLKKKKIPGYKGEIFVISAVTNDGLNTLMDFLWQAILNEN